jgi:hypothetical protein
MYTSLDECWAQNEKAYRTDSAGRIYTGLRAKDFNVQPTLEILDIADGAIISIKISRKMKKRINTAQML